jgi:hypothetical protein
MPSAHIGVNAGKPHPFQLLTLNGWEHPILAKNQRRSSIEMAR